MMRVLLAMLVLTTVQVVAIRRRPPNDRDMLATCDEDAVGEKPSKVRIIPIVPNAPDQFWHPEPVLQVPPTGDINYQALEEQYTKLYGVSFNSTLTAVVPPANVQYSRETIMPTPPIEQFKQDLISLNNLLRCDLDIVLEWMKLPEYYYPPYVVAGRCSGSQRCGYPPDAGYRCLPDTVNTLLVDVIRWECCYVLIDRWWMRHCGWRHVQIQSIIHCSCSCSGVIS